MRQVALQQDAVLVPRQAIPLTGDRRCLDLSQTVDFQVPQLGVRHEFAVEDERRTDPRPQGNHQDTSTHAGPGPVTDFCKSGGVGVVHDLHGPVQPGF